MTRRRTTERAMATGATETRAAHSTAAVPPPDRSSPTVDSAPTTATALTSAAIRRRRMGTSAANRAAARVAPARATEIGRSQRESLPIISTMNVTSSITSTKPKRYSVRARKRLANVLSSRCRDVAPPVSGSAIAEYGDGAVSWCRSFGGGLAAREPQRHQVGGYAGHDDQRGGP